MTLRIQYGNKSPVRTSIAGLAERGERGRDWYAESRVSIVHYAESQDLDPGYVCDVLAILSPRVQVARNVALAREYIETGDMRRGVMKARRRALDYYETWGTFGGPKVNAFSRALRDGGGDACVIDAWLFRAFGLTTTVQNYRRAETKVRRAANRLGWAVAETQAALWVGTREACGFTDHSPLNMEIAA